MARNILDWLDERVRKSPNRIAYADKDDEITFIEVRQKALAAASQLLQYIKPGSPIVVISDRHILTPVAYISIVYAGCYYVPIDSTLPIRRMKMIYEKVKPALVLVDKKNKRVSFPFLAHTHCIVIENAVSNPIRPRALAKVRRQIISTDPMYVLFTSGSTGVPKGVITSHQSLMCYIKEFTRAINISSNDILGCQAAFDYVAAIRDLYIPIFCGAQTSIIPIEYFAAPAKLFDYINERKISILAWAATALVIPAKLGVFTKRKLNFVQKIIFTGSIMPSRFLRMWQKNLPHAKFVNQYGPTEATASCTFHVIDHLVEENETLPIGKPYNNYKILLLNEDGTPTPEGEIGEIYIGGPALALGYFRDAAGTQASFVTNPNLADYPERLYRTGDLGSLRKDGCLIFHGRKDQQIKHLGHRVELSEIESAGQKIAGIEDCIVLYDAKRELICFLYTGTPIEASILAKEFRSALPTYMVPRKFIYVETFARLPSGKIDRRQLEAELI